MKEIIGPRFACVDLDCVITGNVDRIFSRTDPFIINRYGPCRKNNQKYNGSFFMMDAGVHDQVWSTFDVVSSPAIIHDLYLKNQVVGSDQAWVSYLIESPSTVGTKDGIYDARIIKNVLPKDASIVFFPGPRDPTQNAYTWVKDHYY
jgi:hypothetical protein